MCPARGERAQGADEIRIETLPEDSSPFGALRGKLGSKQSN